MARQVSVGSFQRMQREAAPAAETVANGYAPEANATGPEWPPDGDMASSGQPRARGTATLSADAPTIGEQLQRLGVELLATADMPRSLLVTKIEIAAQRAGLAPSEDEIQAEADRIVASFDRTGPRAPDWRRPDPGLRDMVATADIDGVVTDVRPAELTPDRGPEVGTTHHAVTDDDQRFSGAGDDDAQQQSMFLVPSDRDFNGRLYREAPELANIAERLIGEHGFLEELVNCDVRWYWKRKTGVSKGRVKIGFMKRASDLLGHFSGADFIGWLSATTARDGKFTDTQVEAAVFHQLLHIGSDDKGNWIFSPHDFEGFAQEVRHYGTWTSDLKLGGQAFVAAHQMGLFTDADDEEDEDGEEIAEEVIRQIDEDEDDDPLADHDL